MRRSGNGFRVVSADHPGFSTKLSTCPRLPITDRIMRDTFWIGVYPGMTAGMLKHMTGVLKAFLNGK